MITNLSHPTACTDEEEEVEELEAVLGWQRVEARMFEECFHVSAEGVEVSIGEELGEESEQPVGKLTTSKLLFVDNFQCTSEFLLTTTDAHQNFFSLTTCNAH
jgi:hypothetical protein